MQELPQAPQSLLKDVANKTWLLARLARTTRWKITITLSAQVKINVSSSSMPTINKMGAAESITLWGVTSAQEDHLMTASSLLA